MTNVTVVLNVPTIGSRRRWPSAGVAALCHACLIGASSMTLARGRLGFRVVFDLGFDARFVVMCQLLEDGGSFRAVATREYTWITVRRPASPSDRRRLGGTRAP